MERWRDRGIEGLRDRETEGICVLLSLYPCVPASLHP
jgi:hypothetical protein